jgi:hypothetical protein
MSGGRAEARAARRPVRPENVDPRPSSLGLASSSRWASVLGIGALAAYAGLLSLTAPAWPDDWDGVGFLESVRRFDLDHFQPHPPGYPVYVASLRVAALVARTPMGACMLVAVASGVTAVAFVWSAARRAAGERAAWAAASLVAATPLVWRACSGVGSEAPALACAAACAWGLSPGRTATWAHAAALGLGAGLGLGVRLSWAPLYMAALLLAPPPIRARAWALCAGSLGAWAIPLAIRVGPSHLVELTSIQFAGHAQRWGGTMVTEPGPARLVWLLRDVFVDGLGVGADALGLALGGALIVAIAMALLAWSRVRWAGWIASLGLVAPYLAWIAVGQNLHDQPRHALPLVAILSAAIARAGATSRRAFAVVGVLAVLVATRTALDSHARRTIAPPAAQLVERARAQPSPERLAVFGVASVRFFAIGAIDGTLGREASAIPARSDGAGSDPWAFTAGTLGDVQARLGRLDALPSRVWVTSEVDGLAGSPWPLERVATLCRPPRIERRAPCLEVYAWKLPYLRPAFSPAHAPP